MNVGKEVSVMQRMTVAELRERYEKVFGEACRSNHRQWLIRRITWRLQANAEGDLSERARKQAAELANDADLRMKAPPQKPKPSHLRVRFESCPGRAPLPKSPANLQPPVNQRVREFWSVWNGQRAEKWHFATAPRSEGLNQRARNKPPWHHCNVTNPLKSCGLATRTKKRRALSCSAFRVNQWVAETRSQLKGSPTWTRTKDLAVNSRSLYQLSYRGMWLCSTLPLTHG
jgi:hypothetical protein